MDLLYTYYAIFAAMHWSLLELNGPIVHILRYRLVAAMHWSLLELNGPIVHILRYRLVAAMHWSLLELNGPIVHILCNLCCNALEPSGTEWTYCTHIEV